MKTSEKVDLIISSLLKVKTKLQAVAKSADNPFYKSKYATLEAHLLEVEPLLAENGLLLLQPTGVNEQGLNTVSSVIYHISGQFVSSELVMGSLDAQKTGASVTYYRRFTLGALLGMIAADDDGNVASGKTDKVTQTSKVADKQDSKLLTTRPSFKRPAKAVVKDNSKPVAQVQASSGNDI